MPVHLGGGEEAAEQTHAPVRERMAVKVVHQDAQPGDPVHLSEDVDGVGPGEVVEEKRRRRDIKRVGVLGEIEGVAYLDGHATPHASRETMVEIPARVVDRPGVQIDPDDLDAASAPMPEVHEIDETVAAARPDVQNSETPMGDEDRPEHRPRGAIPAEKPVREPQISERNVQPVVGDGQVVHDLVDMDAAGEVGSRREMFDDGVSWFVYKRIILKCTTSIIWIFVFDG